MIFLINRSISRCFKKKTQAMVVHFPHHLFNYCCLLFNKSCLTLLWPHGLEPTRLLCPWDFPGKNTGVGCHILLQGSFQPRDWADGPFPGGTSGKEPACQLRRQKRLKFDPWIGKIIWRRARQSTPVFLPGESHGRRSLMGYSPKGGKESDTTEMT